MFCIHQNSNIGLPLGRTSADFYDVQFWPTTFQSVKGRNSLKLDPLFPLTVESYFSIDISTNPIDSRLYTIFLEEVKNIIN